MSSDPRNGAPSPPPDAPPGAPGTAGSNAEAELELAAATRERGEELLDVLERHAPGEGAHARAAGTYAFVGAIAAKQGRGRAELIREAAKLHTVGKLYLPAALLGAPAETLAPAERERLDSHHEAGAALARGAGVDETICAWILHAREHFDGSGQGGIAGAEIPIEARIIRAACRCAHAVASEDPSQSTRAAARELRQRAGGELDPAVAEPLAAMLERTAERSPS